MNAPPIFRGWQLYTSILQSGGNPAGFNPSRWWRHLPCLDVVFGRRSLRWSACRQFCMPSTPCLQSPGREGLAQKSQMLRRSRMRSARRRRKSASMQQLWTGPRRKVGKPDNCVRAPTAGFVSPVLRLNSAPLPSAIQCVSTSNGRRGATPGRASSSRK